MHHQPSISFRKSKLAVYSKGEQSDEDNSLNKQSRNTFINTRTLASAALVATTAILSYPSWSHAIDVAAISGGATSVAAASTTQVDGFMASLAETGFYQAFSLVFVSEIGDKTFFMAGLLAMKTSKFISFIGSMGALFVMTLISVLIGQSFHAVPAGFGEGVLGGLPLDDVAAVLAFAFFGVKTLQDALTMEEGESVMDEELKDAEEEVEGSDTTNQTTTLYVYNLIMNESLVYFLVDDRRILLAISSRFFLKMFAAFLYLSISCAFLRGIDFFTCMWMNELAIIDNLFLHGP